MLAALARCSGTALQVSCLFEHERVVVVGLAQFRCHLAGRDKVGGRLIDIAVSQLEYTQVVVRLGVSVVVDQSEAEGAGRQCFVSGALRK